MDSFLKRRHDAPNSVSRRMISAVLLQNWYSPKIGISEGQDIANKVVVLTGGGVGIGFETAKELYRRGAHVIISSRSLEKLKTACETIKSSFPDAKAGSISCLALDLSDLESVVQFTLSLQEKLASENRTIDILVENSGVWPRAHSTSKQGYEIAFATNTLGHYLLRNRLHNIFRLRENQLYWVE
jgi:NAD(P)-dependent dehydrogenase (short-subunit alcohol dehydrogenase family)